MAQDLFYKSKVIQLLKIFISYVTRRFVRPTVFIRPPKELMLSQLNPVHTINILLHHMMDITKNILYK